MAKFLPLFPLANVFYPGQQINLHIFEPRYIQLISDCEATGKSFGIPAVINGQVNEFGTEVNLVAIEKKYDGGAMDIRVSGKGIFRILELLRDVPQKLYAAGIVQEHPHLPFDTQILNPTLEELVRKLHRLLGTDFELRKKINNPLSFDLAPYLALSLEEQCRLLSSVSERGRQWFMIQHLQKTIPSLEAAEQVKSKIKRNGHFQNEIPPRF